MVRDWWATDRPRYLSKVKLSLTGTIIRNLRLKRNAGKRSRSSRGPEKYNFHKLKFTYEFFTFKLFHSSFQFIFYSNTETDVEEAYIS